jgi:hypothetical protein
MCANNLVNGVYVCENNHTENTVLRTWGGFKGSGGRVIATCPFIFPIENS